MAYSLSKLEKLIKDIKERQQKEQTKTKNTKVGYAPKCKVCNSEYLDEIEELREEGYTYEEILEDLEIDDISIMSLSRHFQNHYPKSQKYKNQQRLQMLENIKEAYLKYPFLEEYFENKDLQYLEDFNTSYGFCTDRFGLCGHLEGSTVSNGNANINRLLIERDTEIQQKSKNWFFDKDDETRIKLKYNDTLIICLSCRHQIQENRLNLLERIITYNFLNVPPESKELYFNLLEFDGTPDEFIQMLEEGKPEK